jgi:hypothetical protein
MATIIDRNEHVSLLSVGALDTMTIEKDSGTPHKEAEVRVSASGISLGVGSSILIQNDAVLTLRALVAADVLGNIDIGNGGGLTLNSTIGAGVLSNINFVGHQETARLVINAANLNITGNINGFGVHDSIILGNIAATRESFVPGLLGYGTLVLYNAAGTQVGSLGLVGNYTSAEFDLLAYKTPNGGEATRITYVAPNTAVTPEGHGFAVPDAQEHGAMAGAASLHTPDAMVPAHMAIASFPTA